VRVVNTQHQLKFLVILITLGVLTLGFACAGMIGHASMHDAPMSSTAVVPTDNQECCITSIAQHVEQWKGVPLILPKEMRNGFTLLILALALAFAASYLRFGRDVNNQPLLALRLYARDNPDLALFNHLRIAFARGTLNPKIY